MTPTLSTMAWTPAVDRPDLTRAAVAAAITTLTWTDPPDPDPADLGAAAAADLAGSAAVAAVAAAVGRPEVTRTAVGGAVAGYGLVGVELTDCTGRTRVYALHHAGAVVVVAVEFTPHL